MLTHVINTTSITPNQRHCGTSARVPTQRVVIVNGGKEVLSLFDTVLDAGQYDVVFVETTAHAYSQIRRVQPDLVILCLRMDDPAGFRVLSMLKLDPDTSAIPILTCTAEDELEPQEEATESEPEAPEEDFLMSSTLLRMN